MNTENRGFNHQQEEIIKEFVVKKMAVLLTDPDCERKIKEDKEVLEKLGLQLAANDLQPLIATIGASNLIDYENKQIKDGQVIQRYFAILAILFHDSSPWTYYKMFAKVKQSEHNFSNFYYVTTALKVLDHNNWDNNSLNQETQQEIKKFYLDTTLNLSLNGRDKIYNLNILQHDLEISLNREEESELSKHIKQNIMTLVDLIDQLRKTSFGIQPLVEDNSNKPVEDKQEDIIEKPLPLLNEETGQKKTFKWGFGKK